MKAFSAVVVILMVTGWGRPAVAADPSPGAPGYDSPAKTAGELAKILPNIDTPGGMGTALKWAAMVTVMAVAPAVLVMVTSFTRIIVVLGLLRQALGTAQLPPNQVLFGLAMLMTMVVMTPTYMKVHRSAVVPYLDGRIGRSGALDASEEHIREFMTNQIEAAGNSKDVYLFLPDELDGRKDLNWSDVPTLSLIPAFAISELKVAFWMGFRIFLPFLVVDMLVATVLVSMGMLMLPPVLISLPFKLLLFVLADGWYLVVGTLMRSFGG
jgi:flagellar biosynthetic protein FliP